MILPDVNVLVYAFATGAVNHTRYRSWLDAVLEAPEAWAYSEIVLSGFVRVVTHPRVFDPPAPMETALRFCSALRGAPNAVAVSPGERHWEIFESCCRESGARGNLVADAYLAALAIETGSEWITTDRDFARFPRLRWRHPLA